MFHRYVSIGSVLALGACGGASTGGNNSATTGGNNFEPLAETGFAISGETIAAGDSFTLENATRVVGTGPNLNFAEQDITFKRIEDDASVEVTIDGQTHIVPRVSEFRYFIEEGRNRIIVNRIRGSRDEAEIIEVFSFVDETLNTSLLPIGFDTNPSEVSARTGTADMRGSVFVTVRNGFDSGISEGDIAISANFDANTISGNFNIENVTSPTTEFDVAAASYALNETEIDKNGFAGTLTLTEGGEDGSISDATYGGRFFGQNAPTVGGQISATFTSPDRSQPTLIQGAFIASE